MSKPQRLIRQTLTIARRDFTATVFTPTFLLFLLAPLIMLSFSLIGGLSASAVGKNAEDKARSYVILAGEDAAAFAAADRDLRAMFGSRDQPVTIEIIAPSNDIAAQARALLAEKERDVPAVLYGTLAAPQIIHANPTSTQSKYLAAVAEKTLRDRAADVTAPLSRPHFRQIARDGPSLAGQSGSAFFGVFGLFFIVLMLAGQAVGTMAEERSNKVIEVLAAAVPLESVFLGKLIGMFGVALLFITFWGVLLGSVTVLVPPDTAKQLAELKPAIGLLPYGLLFLAYFTMAYMLLGSVFLGVGAQASTPREIQMLSLPITIFQVAMFGLAAVAAMNPDEWYATFAEIFPFSSPFAMIGKAANSSALWPHFAAIAWQLLWVSLSIAIGARFFRRGVLQSAGPKFRFGRKKPATV